MKHLGLGAAMLAASVLAACEKPKDEATEKDVAPAATEKDVAPAATEKDVAPAAVEEVTTEETIVVPPTAAEEDAVMEGVTVTSPMVSEDAPKLPHKGEPPSPNQPQPVVPEEPAAKPEGPAAEEDAVMEGVTVTSPMVSEDAPKLPHKGEPPSPNQPQPVVPEEPAAKPEGPAAEEDAVMEGVTVTSPMVSEDAPKLPHKGEPPSPNQPQPVVPEEPAAKPEGPAAEEDAVMEGVTVTSPMVSEDAPKLPHKGEPPSPNQPQPVVPEEPAAKPEGPAAEEDAVMEGVTVTSPMVSEDAPKLPHKGEPPSPNQPQPVYPDSADAGEPAAVIVEEAEAVMTTPEGKTVVISEEHVTIVVPPTVAEDAPTAPHKGEAPSPNQPQPVYPDGL